MSHYSQHIRIAASTVFYGGVIAYPTEGVFGLGCDPFNPDAVSRILAIKKRPINKGLILISDDISRFIPYFGDLTEQQLQQLQTSWPGPNTWVLPHNGLLPSWITGGRNTVAMRVTNHPTAKALCAELRMPLISTSANRHSRPALETKLQVQRQLASKLDYILPGKVLTPGKASQIHDLISGQQFRS